ncbi:MAG: TolC family protein [Planctomycetes bacterium]|nr:TolC family protein [Planctomycetota bacterium]
MLALSACVSYEPDPLEPENVLRALSQRAEQDVHVDAVGPWRAEWFPLEAAVRIEDGLSLGEANALALFFSPTLRAARADARIAGAQVLQAGILENPQLFVGPRVSVRNSEVIFPINLSWQLPLWGTRDAQCDLAEARLTAKSLELIDLEVDTLLEVRAAFLRLARLRREQAVLDQVATVSGEVVGWVERLRDSGEVDSAAVFLARTERDEAAAAVEDVRSQAIRSRRELLELLGLLPDAPVDFAVDGAGQLPDLGEPARETLLRLPELRAAEAEHAAAEARLRLEISKQYPGINLGVQFESDRGDPMVGPGIGVTLPLFDRNRGNIAAAEESRDLARESYQRTLLGAAHREARARDDVRAAERVLELHRGGALGDAEAAARSLEVRLRTGQASVVEVLAAQRAIGRARARVLQLEEQVAVARLRAAVAGGLALQAPAVGDEETNR